MSRPLTVAAVLLTTALVACTSGEDRGARLKPGSYAGSTAAARPIVIEVGGGGVTIDTNKTTRRENGVFVEEKRPRREFKCEHQDSPDQIVDIELVCEITTAGRTETVELMQL